MANALLKSIMFNKDMQRMRKKEAQRKAYVHEELFVSVLISLFLNMFMILHIV